LCDAAGLHDAMRGSRLHHAGFAAATKEGGAEQPWVRSTQPAATPTNTKNGQHNSD
jgi:hypothetical protein